jgi:hypothetical protein
MSPSFFLFLHSLLTTSCHFFGESLLSVFADKANASGAVAAENEFADFANQVIVGFAFPDIHLAFGTGVDPFFFAALADFAPRSLFVFMAARAFAHAIFAACSAVEPAGGNQLGISDDFFHG